MEQAGRRSEYKGEKEVEKWVAGTGERERQTTLQTCIPLLRFFKRVQAAASRDRPCSRCIQVRREPFTCARIMRLG